MQRDEVTLVDIAEAARLTLAFIQDATREAFMADLKTQSAVLHQITVMGEAVKRLSPEFRARHPAIPWTAIAGMRDHLIHAYDTVDLDEVWDTATEDVPGLLAQLESLLPDEP